MSAHITSYTLSFLARLANCVLKLYYMSPALHFSVLKYEIPQVLHNLEHLYTEKKTAGV